MWELKLDFFPAFWASRVARRAAKAIGKGRGGKKRKGRRRRIESEL